MEPGDRITVAKGPRRLGEMGTVREVLTVSDESKVQIALVTWDVDSSRGDDDILIAALQLLPKT